VFWVLQCIK